MIQAFASGSVTGQWYAGGLVGTNVGAWIRDSYATGSVTANSQIVGGFAGFNSGIINTSYATGSVSGTTNMIGGLVGSNSGTVNASYWNTESSGRAIGIGASSGTAVNGVTSLTTAQATNPFTLHQCGHALGLRRHMGKVHQWRQRRLYGAAVALVRLL